MLSVSVCSMTACGHSSENGQPALSTKKGVCVSRYDDGSEKSAQLLEDLGISWYYNWGAKDFAENIDAEYVPMVWGTWSVNAQTLGSIKEGYEAGRYKYLLTFNEPDVYTPGVSSGVSVETALDLWPQLEALGIPLSSPAPTNYATGWLDEFMAGASERGYRVDFLALHCYQVFSDLDAVAELRQELIEIYEKYQLPIWITEFAAIDIWAWGGGNNPACTQEAAVRYTKDVTDMLESLGFVERYAWFIDNTNSPAEKRDNEAQYTFLYNNDDTISETGKVYKAQLSTTPLEISTVLKNGKVGKSFKMTFTARGGKGGYVFSDAAPEGVTVWNDLPEGFSLSASGVLSGTAKGAGKFIICISVKDRAGQMTFKYYELVIES